MHDLIEALGREELAMLGTFLILGVVVIALVAIVQWRAHLRAEMETSLKRDMLNRGMTADEIVQVISATGRCSSNRHAQRPYREAADYPR